MVGMLGHIGIARETTWGTGVAATDYVEAISENIVTTIERFETRQIIAGLYEPDDSAGVARHEGDIVFAVGPRTIGHFLRGVFGVASNSVVLSGFFFSTNYTPVQAYIGSTVPLDSYTLEIFRPGINNLATSFRYRGAVVSKLAMNLKPNQDMRATASIIAKDMTSLSKTTPTFASSPTQFYTFDVSSIQLPSGTSVTRFGEINIEIDNQLEGVALLDGTTSITRIARTGPQVIRVSGVVEFDDFTDFDAFRNQTEQRMLITMFRANSFALTIDMPRLVFTEFPVAIAGRGRVTSNFTMQARYHSGSGNAIRVTNTNVTTG